MATIWKWVRREVERVEEPTAGKSEPTARSERSDKLVPVDVNVTTAIGTAATVPIEGKAVKKPMNTYTLADRIKVSTGSKLYLYVNNGNPGCQKLLILQLSGPCRRGPSVTERTGRRQVKR